MTKRFLLLAVSLVLLSLLSAGIADSRTVTITPQDTQKTSDVQTTVPAETIPTETTQPETIPPEITTAETPPPETIPPETTTAVTSSPETVPPETTTAVTSSPETTSPETIPAETTPPARTTEPDDSTVTYVLNKNTKKFHRPNCASVRQMKEKNRLPVTSTRDEVIAQGYTPCKNCDP